MKINSQRRITKILTSIVALTITFDLNADGHDQVVPISDDGALAIQIALTLAAIGLIFLLASFLKRFIRKRNLPEPKSYFLIVLLTLFIAWFWNWIAREMNLLRDIADLAITPITILILFFAPMLFYRISPKKNSDDSRSISGDIE